MEAKDYERLIAERLTEKPKQDLFGSPTCSAEMLGFIRSLPIYAFKRKELARRWQGRTGVVKRVILAIFNLFR